MTERLSGEETIRCSTEINLIKFLVVECLAGENREFS
jgi:hypothetical protein